MSEELVSTLAVVRERTGLTPRQIAHIAAREYRHLWDAEDGDFQALTLLNALGDAELLEVIARHPYAGT